MIKQVAIFETNKIHELENLINQFIRNNDLIKILEIKIFPSHLIDIKHSIYVALIIYEDEL
jgi:transcription elongation factor GreA-like protein